MSGTVLSNSDNVAAAGVNLTQFTNTRIGIAPGSPRNAARGAIANGSTLTAAPTRLNARPYHNTMYISTSVHPSRYVQAVFKAISSCSHRDNSRRDNL